MGMKHHREDIHGRALLDYVRTLPLFEHRREPIGCLLKFKHQQMSELEFPSFRKKNDPLEFYKNHTQPEHNK